MPLYGKGRTQRTIHNARLKEGAEIARVNGKRRIIGEQAYKNTSTPIIKIEQRTGFPIRATIQRMWQRKKRPIVVLDWGCGDGTAATQLAKRFGNKVKVFGYSHVSYSAWKNNKLVTFIHEPKEDLGRFAKGQVDLVYSHWGASHVYPLHQYFEEMSKHIALGGKIVIAPYSFGILLPLNGEPTPVGKGVFKATISSKGPSTTLIVTRVK